MSRRRAVLLASGLLLLVVVVLGALVGWRALQVNDSLQQAVRDAEATRTALESGDQATIDTALTSLQASSRKAAEQTDGAIWSLATALPVVGDDASGVRTAARVVSDLSNRGIAPLADQATQLDRLLPTDGSIDLDAVRDLQDPVRQAAEALTAARADLAAEDTSGFVGQFKSKYRELTVLVGDAAGAMDSAAVGIDLLPELLGAEGRRDYLLVFQNNAEIRATGGLPGAMSIVSADDGAVALGRQDSAARFGERAEPVLPLTDDEVDIYSEKLGTFMLDANFTPDWPRAAEIMRARWEEVHPEELAGVLTVDTVAVSYLLGATGPVEVGPYTLTQENAVDVLLSQVYADIPDPTEQDAFFRTVAATVFDRVAGGGVGNPRDLLRALVRAGDEGRAYVNLTDEAEQAEIAARRVAGASEDGEGAASLVDVSLLDGTGSKMSYYLDYDVKARSTSCTDGTARLALQMRLESTPPADPTTLPRYVTGGVNVSTEPGEQLVQVRMATPSGGSVSGFTIRGKDFDPDEDAMLGDRQVSTVYLLLEPGKPADITWEVEVPQAAASVPVRVTPGLRPEDYSGTVSTTC
ncbi:DUF4012 domain-containing protein [Nocardioides sp.]|uniref:DUF4012 domain-containing protein n=1 Tax=Nocardioides sp. TaxID=35761 RepID=UPI002638AB8C|nr:DUF4012 domain-containing protein [Nocardioides sp.]